MWTYYKQTYVNGVWLLFRRNDTRYQEAYRFKEGWAKSNELFLRESKGDIDENDRISEADAFGLIRSIGEDPERLAEADAT